MRLFRQPQPGDRPAVFRQIAAAEENLSCCPRRFGGARDFEYDRYNEDEERVSSWIRQASELTGWVP